MFFFSDSCQKYHHFWVKMTIFWPNMIDFWLKMTIFVQKWPVLVKWAIFWLKMGIFGQKRPILGGGEISRLCWPRLRQKNFCEKSTKSTICWLCWHRHRQKIIFQKSTKFAPIEHTLLTFDIRKCSKWIFLRCF